MPDTTESPELERAKRNALRVAKITTRKARAKHLEWTRRRNDAIAIAHLHGASLREIAQATELSHVGVKKILDAR